MKRQALTELRTADRVVLTKRIAELHTEIDRTRVKEAFGQAKNPHALRFLRRELAQLLTLRRERTEETHSTRSARSGSVRSTEEIA